MQDKSKQSSCEQMVILAFYACIYIKIEEVELTFGEEQLME